MTREPLTAQEKVSVISIELLVHRLSFSCVGGQSLDAESTQSNIRVSGKMARRHRAPLWEHGSNGNCERNSEYVG